MGHMYIFKRGDCYIYRRRIPQEAAHLDRREEVKISLKTKNLTEALCKAEIYNQKMEAFWVALIRSGNAVGIEEKYAAAVQIAKAHGFAYKTAQDVAQAPPDEVLARVEQTGNTPTEDALLGGVSPPKIRLSDCNRDYWDLSADRTIRKGAHQKKKWENPRRAAMVNLIEVVEDKAISDLTRADILAFREWWNEKIKLGMAPNSANKQMRAIKMMIQTVANARQIDIDCDRLFAKTSFTEMDNSRPPFEAAYVEKVLLPGLGGLLDDARLVFWALADTGARPSEIIGLQPDDIRLDEETPYIWIRGELKTKTSARQIPLVGSALHAFRLKPEGFNTRWKSADSFSNIVNKYLRDHNLLPTPEHSLYSLRHTFKDRLRDIEAPEEIIDDLMGHKKSGPKYGRGHRLDKKLIWLQKIAYHLIFEKQ